jgi:signal transduction histidine kinase
MIEKSLITRTEREIYQEYEQQRRIQMLGSITPVFMAVCAAVAVILFAVLWLLPEGTVARQALLVTSAMLGLCVVGLGAGLLATRSGRLNLATAFVAGTSALGTSASVAIWGVFIGLDPFAMIELTPFSVVIVLAGLLGSVRWIVIATAVMNALTVLLLLLVPQGSAFGGEQLLIVPVALSHQWLFAVLMIVIWRLFRRTVNEVGVAYQRAQQLDALKDEFIASVNHELRTPLMTMQTYLDVLRSAPEQLPPEQVASVVDHVGRVSDSLVELVQSILSTREIDRDLTTITPEPVRVKQALDAAILLIDPRMAQQTPRDLVLDVPETLTVMGEAVRLQQVLTNLISNAVKYSPPGTRIEIRAQPVEATQAVGARRGRRHAPSEPTTVEITVRDYGHGIPPDQAVLLFNRFVRLPRDLASKTTGTGLGLYLSRIQVESMHGRIWVESTGVDGEGSTFHVTLPRAPRGRVPSRPISNEQRTLAETSGVV